MASTDRLAAPTSTAPRALAAAAAIVAWLALALQLALLVSTQAAAGRGLLHALLLYLGFFTILTNLLCAAILTAAAVRGAPSTAPRPGPLQPWLVTSAAVAIAIVGAVYVLVLRPLWHPTGLQLLADIMLHYVDPLLFLGFWSLGVPRGSLHWADLPRMLVYPLAYLVYVFARGAATGLYPYFFIEAPTIGYIAALRNALGLLLAYTLLAAVAIVLKRPPA